MLLGRKIFRLSGIADVNRRVEGDDDAGRTGCDLRSDD